MRDNITPEEKLLRLIKGSKQDFPTDKKSAMAMQVLKPAIKNSMRTLVIKYGSLRYIKKLIWLAFGASCIYLIVSFIYPWVGLKKIKLPEVTSENTAELKSEPGTELKPYEFYLQGIQGRQLFGSVSKEETEKPIGIASSDLIKDINLVGIISGDNPQAVIEDKKAQKTYYITKGQFIGELQVEDIQEGKIILNYRGERFELYL